MKTCTKCKLDKSETEYHKKGNKLKSWCKACQAIIHKKHYEANRSHRIKRARIRNENEANKIQKYVLSMKSAPCTDCNKTYPPYVMDFDHVSGKKVQNVSNMSKKSQWGYTLKSVLAEIAKCELVCSNCHRIRTFTRR